MGSKVSREKKSEMEKCILITGKWKALNQVSRYLEILCIKDPR
jgi:hypothetical protein